MSYTYEKISSNKAKLTITVPAEQFDAAMQKAYLKIRGSVNVPGFRKGKAPRKMIENLYGEGVFYDDAFDICFNEAYRNALTETGLEVVDRPEVDVKEIGSGKDLVAEVEVFVRPDVTLGEYKNLTVEVEKQTVTDEMIDARVNQDREKNARVIDKTEGTVENGDVVNLDYAGSVDGVAFAGGTAEGQTLEIGSHQFIPGFEEQMVGMAIGEEKDLQVKFPEQYHAENLAGKDAVFHVKVNSIQSKELPELDDDFAADVSDFDTYAEYRENIVKELTERAEKNNKIMAENALIEKAVENAQMDVPNGMVETQVDEMLREMEMRMMYQGLRMEDYLKYTGMTIEEYRASFADEALNRVKVELTLDAIRKAEGIEPTEDEVKVQVEEQAKRLGREVEAFEKGLTDEQRNYLKDTAAIQKVVDMMFAGATVNEKTAE